MKWKEVNADGAPDDKDKVMISVEGIYYMAVYYDSDRSFKVIDHRGSFRFYADKQKVYWTTLGEVE